MIPVSGMNTGAARPLPAMERASGAPEVQGPEPEARDPSPKPVTDEYVPEEPREPSGRYWMDRDENGRPRIYFDDPERAEKGAEGPERKNGGGEERCAGSTDEVDREIEKLKKKKEDLERRLSTETDEARIKDLERRLAQTERELREKDNDAYRRRHARFTKLS